MKYFDSHGHINGSFFKDDVLSSIKATDYILMPGTGKKDSLKGIALAKEHSNLFAAAGIHPCDAKDKEYLFLNKINPEDIVAVGETGIDLHYDDNPSLEKQIESFEFHIDYAIKHNKVLIIHMRDSYKEVYGVLSEYKESGLKFIIHSFSGNYEQAISFIELGAMISFSGVVTFKNAKEVLDAAIRIPLEKIICETDSPFLAPVPYRGKSNKPEYVKYVVDHIAANRNEADEIVKQTIFKNTMKLFNK